MSREDLCQDCKHLSRDICTKTYSAPKDGGKKGK